MTAAASRAGIRQACLAALLAAGCLLGVGWPIYSTARSSLDATTLAERMAALDRAALLSLIVVGLTSLVAGMLRYRQLCATRAAQDHAERMRMITDHVPVLIAYIDQEERYRFCNGAFRALLGIAPEQALGRTVHEIRGECVYRQVQPHMARALSGQRTSFEGYSDTGAAPFHFHSEYVPDVVDGVVRGFFAMTVDCTAIHEAEQKSAAAERVDALHRLLSHMAGSFSNQLATVQGYLESIDVDSVTAADLEITRLSMEDCVRTVEQVQLLAGYSGATFDVIPVAALAEDILLQWQQATPSVPLQIHAGYDLPMIRGSTLLLRSALVEVLENAREADESAQSAIVLRATRQHDSLPLSGTVLVNSPMAGSGLLISITDRGRGMSEGELRRAGDPFFSTKSGRKGLGLSLVAGIVRAHAGRLLVHSRPDQGTTVTIALPSL